MEASAALLKEQTAVLGHLIVFSTMMYFLNPRFLFLLVVITALKVSKDRTILKILENPSPPL